MRPFKNASKMVSDRPDQFFLQAVALMNAACAALDQSGGLGTRISKVGSLFGEGKRAPYLSQEGALYKLVTDIVDPAKRNGADLAKNIESGLAEGRAGQSFYCLLEQMAANSVGTINQRVSTADNFATSPTAELMKLTKIGDNGSGNAIYERTADYYKYAFDTKFPKRPTGTVTSAQVISDNVARMLGNKLMSRPEQATRFHVNLDDLMVDDPNFFQNRSMWKGAGTFFDYVDNEIRADFARRSPLDPTLSPPVKQVQEVRFVRRGKIIKTLLRGL